MKRILLGLLGTWLVLVLATGLMVVFDAIPTADADYVEIINLSEGDEVNAHKFTIVAKGVSYAVGDNLLIQVKIINNTTGDILVENVNVTTK